MGQGQQWLTSAFFKALSCAPPWTYLLLLVLTVTCNVRCWPVTTEPTHCPSVCRCSWLLYSTKSWLHNDTAHLAAACTHAGLTDLPASLPAFLVSLNVQGNHLTQLPESSLLNDLQFLDLSNNSLIILSKETFQNMTKLTTLLVSFNRIEMLENRVFENLAAIDSINLAFNQLTSLNSEMLFGLDNVQVLNLTGNLIDEISNQTFFYLHRLKILDLSYNQLQYLPTDAFQGLDSVQTILLQNNDLTSIMGGFNSLLQLSTLDLSYNKLDALENGTFVKLPHLSSLQLSFNNITDISPTCFTHTAALQMLQLQGNPLKQLQDGLFDNFPSLQVLDLSQMPYLRSVKFDALEGLLSLSFLNLSCNPHLSFLHPQLLALVPKLTVLDLRSNNISMLSHITFHSNPHLSHLYLAQNPFQCGCSMAWMLSQPADNNSAIVTDFDSVQCELQSNGSAVPISQVSQEMTTCNNVTLINVTHTVSAKIGSQLVLRCDYSADESGVLTWITPRGLTFHYHPFHPEAISHLVQTEAADNVTGDFHTEHTWHSQRSYDSNIQHNFDHIVLQEDGSLYIDFVLRSDAGPYKCILHNSQHSTSATITLLLDYTVLFDVKIMSIVVGLACAASFFTLNTVYVIIMWGARKLVNKRRRERIHKLMVSLDDYRTSQIARIRANYSYQLGRIRDHYHAQSMRLKDNYTIQMKRVRRGCSNQVERIRDNYHTRLNHLKEYSSHQIQQIRDATNNQIIRIRDYGSSQMERLRESYKLQQQHVLKVIEAMNLENCRTVVETECMRTESMIFDINLPDLDDDNTSTETEEASSQHSQAESVYITAVNSDGSSQESLATVVGQSSQDCILTEVTTTEVLPSDPPDYHLCDSEHISPSESSSFSALCEEELEISSRDSGEDVRETVV